MSAVTGMKGAFAALLAAALVTPQAQVPVVSSDPAVQRMVEQQLAGAASVRLDPTARIASLDLTARPLREIVDAIAKAGGITVRYAAGMTMLDTSAAVKSADQTVEDTLRAVLQARALTFQAMGPKAAFIYPDTPANREKYTASIRVFPVASDPAMLGQQLNGILAPSADGFWPMVLTVKDPRTIVVRAVPEVMTVIANWIAQHDKGGYLGLYARPELVMPVADAGHAVSVQAPDVGPRLEQLSSRVARLESRTTTGAGVGVTFLFGAFCALWAQNTKRSAWSWFFLGAFFNVIAMLVLLAKNADDLRADGGTAAGSREVVLAVILGLLIVVTFTLLYWRA